MSCPVFNISPTSSDEGLTSYVSDGDTTTYTIGFEYLDSSQKAPGESSDYIKCYSYDGSNIVELSYVLASETELTLSETVTSGYTIYIVRKLNILGKEIDWSNESEFNQTNMNRMADQCLQNDQDLWRRMVCLADTVSSLGSDIGGVTDFTYTATSGQTVFELTGNSGVSEAYVVVYKGTTTANQVVLDPSLYTVSDSGGVSRVVLSSGATTGDKVYIKLFQATLVAYTVANGSISEAQLADGSVTIAKINFDASGTNNQAFMKRSGSWTPSTILYTDIPSFNTGVRLNSIDQMTVPAANTPWNSKKITGLANGATGTQDACTVAQMESYVTTNLPDVTDLASASGSVSFSSTTYTEVDLGFDFDTLLMLVTNTGADNNFTPSNGQAFNNVWVKIRTSSDGTGPTVYKTHAGGSFGLDWTTFTFETISNGFKVKKSGTLAGTFTLQYFACRSFTP